jgi:hypothetical protein
MRATFHNVPSLFSYFYDLFFNNNFTCIRDYVLLKLYFLVVDILEQAQYV